MDVQQSATAQRTTAPPALRLRVKTLLEAGLSAEEIYARLCGAEATAQDARLGHVERAQVAATLDALQADTSAAAPPRPNGGNRPGRAPAFFDDAKRLFSVLNPALGANARGMVVEFIAARPGEGTSTMAREFARVAAQHSERPVLLIDLDWQRPSQFDHFSQDAEHPLGLGGTPGPAVDIGIDPTVLLRFTDRNLAQPVDQMEVSVHRVAATSLYVTRPATLPPGRRGTAPAANFPAFWDQLRDKVGMTVIDAPSFGASYDGLTVSGAADKVIIVLEAEVTRVPVLHEMIGRLKAQGADVAGIIFNKRRLYIPKFIYRWL